MKWSKILLPLPCCMVKEALPAEAGLRPVFDRSIYKTELERNCFSLQPQFSHRFFFFFLQQYIAYNLKLFHVAELTTQMCQVSCAEGETPAAGCHLMHLCPWVCISASCNPKASFLPCDSFCQTWLLGMTSEAAGSQLPVHGSSGHAASDSEHMLTGPRGWTCSPDRDWHWKPSTTRYLACTSPTQTNCMGTWERGNPGDKHLPRCPQVPSIALE